jgi:NAD-dependent deacetylase
VRPAELSVVVLTGAGISADSGVATFRGPGGLWEGQRIEDVATPEAWARDPARVWRFYQLRRAALATVAPNPAHQALVELERRLLTAGARFTLVTQNVDDLHARAGSTRLLPMHGELALLRCERCDGRLRDLARVDPAAFVACPACGHARLRPDVVWFGEVPYHLEEIAAALTHCTHFAAIGTSGVVYPAAGMLAEARAGGARTTILALERPDNARAADQLVLGRAAESVPRWAAERAAEWGLPA